MNRLRRIIVTLPAVVAAVGLLADPVPAGDLDSPFAPGATSSYTLEDLYNRLDTGAAGTQSSFTEPTNGPTAGTVHTVNEIMAKAPAADEDSGATDTDVSAGKTYWGLTNGAWGVRNGTGSAGGLAPSAAQYVFVELAEGNTDVQNGAALLAAYTQAKGLTPGAANRIAVIVPPGRYDLGTGAVTLDTAYIDLVGLTTDREAQCIYGTSNGAGTGVLMQTADNVVIANLTIECTRSSGSLSQDATGPAAYFPNTNLPHTTVRNCLFTATEYAWSMRISIEYAGTYEDCTGGRRSFGGAGAGGTASGTFTNCTGGGGSFGGGGGTAGGTFTRCTGGNQSFGSFGTAVGGRFYYCNGDGSHSWNGDETTTVYCIKNGNPYP